MDIEGRNLSGVDEGVISEGEYLREFASEEEVLAVFRENYMITKDDILRELNYRIKQYKEDPVTINKFRDEKPVSYFKALVRLLEEFKNQVEKAVLFDDLEPFWSYSYTIEETGIHLDLEHCYNVGFEDDGYPRKEWIDQDFRLIDVKTKLLTVEEYGERYGVGPGTVRQWIRRGKIRSAMKAGKEWRIPELAEMRQRGYKLGQYRWEDLLQELPDGYDFINDYKQVDFWQDDKVKSLFLVVFYPREENVEKKKLKLVSKEKEKLELFFIGNPLVKCLSVIVQTYDG